MNEDTRESGGVVVRKRSAKGNALRVLALLPGETDMEMCPECGNPGDTVARRTYSNGSEHAELLCWPCKRRVKNVGKARVLVPWESLPVRRIGGGTVPLFGGGE